MTHKGFSGSAGTAIIIFTLLMLVLATTAGIRTKLERSIKIWKYYKLKNLMHYKRKDIAKRAKHGSPRMEVFHKLLFIFPVPIRANFEKLDI